MKAYKQRKRHRRYPPLPRNLPMPEFISGTAWKVLPDTSEIGKGYVDFAKGEMLVPLGDGQHERRIRLHEQAHIKWTPKKPLDVVAKSFGSHPHVVGIAEDARIGALLAHSGIDLGSVDEATKAIKDKWFGLLDQGVIDAKYLALIAVSTFAMPEGASMRDEIRKRVKDGRAHIAEPAKLIHAFVASCDDFINKGFVRRLIRYHKIPKEFLRKFVRHIESLLKSLEEYHEAVDRGLPPPVHAAIESSKLDQALRASGNLRIETPPLIVRMRDAMRVIKKRAMDTGVALRNPYRFLTDRKVFTISRRKILAPTILVDCSGSMSFDEKRLREFVKHFPLAKIATYSGRDHYGTLRIIADNGMRVGMDEDLKPEYGGNVVDVPALMWLSQQQGPRFWICDGGVTGRGDQAYDIIDEVASEIVEVAKIERFYSPEYFIRRMELWKEGVAA